MATTKAVKTGKRNVEGMRIPLIVCAGDHLSISSDMHVWMGKDFVRVTTLKRVFEIDAATESVHSYPTSEAHQREWAVVGRTV